MKKVSKPTKDAEKASEVSNYREYAEVMRMAATANRCACNISLNVPVTEILPTKDEYQKFLSSLDYLQKMYFKYYEYYTKCANTLAAKSGETAASAAN